MIHSTYRVREKLAVAMIGSEEGSTQALSRRNPIGVGSVTLVTVMTIKCRLFLKAVR